MLNLQRPFCYILIAINLLINWALQHLEKINTY